MEKRRVGIGDPQRGLFSQQFDRASRDIRGILVRKRDLDFWDRGPRGASGPEDQSEDAEKKDRDEESQ